MTSGCVKWFNNKAGYGFITTNDCETNEERDIFVHHSEIKVDQSQYKYLVQGEYVEFTVSPITREAKIDVHATGVRGINGGKLMCETRNEVRAHRITSAPRISSAPQTRRDHTKQDQAKQDQANAKQDRPRPSTAPSARPQLDKADQTEWKVVPRRKNEGSAQKDAPVTFSAPTFSPPVTAAQVAAAPAAPAPAAKATKSKPKQRQPAIEIA